MDKGDRNLGFRFSPQPEEHDFVTSSTMDDHLRIPLAVQFELKLPTWQQYGRFLYTSDHVCWVGVNPLDIWRAETGSFLPCLFNRIPNLNRTTDPRLAVQGPALQSEQDLAADSWFSYMELF